MFSPNWSFLIDVLLEIDCSLGDFYLTLRVFSAMHQQKQGIMHVFFTCPFSASVWNDMASKLGFHLLTNSWEATLDVLIGFTSPKPLKYLTLLVWQTCTYELWREKNDRLGGGSAKPSRILLKCIDLTVRNQITSFWSQNSSYASQLLQLWFSLN